MRISEIAQSDEVQLYWFNAASNDLVEVDEGGHCAHVLFHPRRYGIDLYDCSSDPRDLDPDYDPRIIKEMGRLNWVRVVVMPSRGELNLQATGLRDIHLAARFFVKRFPSIRTIFIDTEIATFATDMHAKLEGERLQAFLRTGGVRRRHGSVG